MLFWFWQQMFFPCPALGSDSVAMEPDLPPAPVTADTDICIRALLDNRFLLTLDDDGIIHQVSSNVLRTLDMEASHIGELSLLSLLHASHQPLFLPQAKTAESPWQKRAQLRHKGGEYGWYSLHYHPHPQGTLLVLEPVATLVEAEHRLRKAQVEAEHSMRERGEFLRHMSHELRTPLNAILGFSEMMEQGVFGTINNEVYSEYLSLIRASGEDLLAKIVDLMDLSAIGAHHMVLNETETPLAEIMQAAVDRLQKVAIDAQVTLSFRPPSYPVMLRGDARLLRKALGHIIQNAIEYNQSGGQVEIQALPEQEGGYRIVVKDNGIGILPSQLKALRYALNDETNLYSHVEAYRPMGLGLTLAKEYLTLHGGYAEIEMSRLKQGTAVALVLPSKRIRSSFATRHTKITHLKLAT